MISNSKQLASPTIRSSHIKFGTIFPWSVLLRTPEAFLTCQSWGTPMQFNIIIFKLHSLISTSFNSICSTHQILIKIKKNTLAVNFENIEAQIHPVLYISTRVWVLRIPNAGRNKRIIACITLT